MSSAQTIAHTSEDGRTQLLIDHLKNTAQSASVMAKEFGCGEWGYLAGLWHDIGKYSPEFQKYIKETKDVESGLEQKPGRVDHSTAGAILAVNNFKLPGRLLAYIIAGHHAGLPDFESDKTKRAALSQRLTQTELLDNVMKAGVPPEILNQTWPKECPKPGTDPALWLRLLFSCVSDADFLDTEAFLEPEKASARSKYPQLAELLLPFLAFMGEKQGKSADDRIN